MMVDTLIKNGIVTTTEGTYPASIAISGERIVALCSDENLPQSEMTIDAKGNYVIPGLVDGHMHFLYPRNGWEENLRSETKAAAAGGCTTAVHQLSQHVTGSIVEGCKKVTTAFEANGYMDLAYSAIVCNMDQIREMREALEYGVSAFKFLLPYRGKETISGIPGIDDGIVYLGLEQIARLVGEGYKTFARIHAESIEVFFRIEDKYREQGREPSTYTEVRPNFIEAGAMQGVIVLAKETGCPLFIVHMSIKEGPLIIARAKLEGVDIVAETCPQYLVLNTDNTDKFVSKVNPPIRHKEDNEALWQAIKDEVIDFVGTDHSPVSRPQRGTDFWRAPVGMAGVETWLPIMLSEGVNKGRITLKRLVEVCCYNPAEKYGLTPRKGMIAVGSDADLVIVDLYKKAKVNGKDLYTQAGDFSCYDGWELKGWPILTMIRGKVVMEEGKVVGRPGFGKFIPTKLK